MQKEQMAVLIDQELKRAAKARSAEEGKSLSDWVQALVHKELTAGARKDGTVRLKEPGV